MAEIQNRNNGLSISVNYLEIIQNRNNGLLISVNHQVNHSDS